jgi:hypothetical protein
MHDRHRLPNQLANVVPGLFCLAIRGTRRIRSPRSLVSTTTDLVFWLHFFGLVIYLSMVCSHLRCFVYHSSWLVLGGILLATLVIYSCSYLIYLFGMVRASTIIHTKLIQSILGTTLRQLLSS